MSRDYNVPFSTRKDRAAVLVRWLREEGIRAFHLPVGSKRPDDHDVYVDKEDADRAVRVWSQRGADQDDLRLLREYRRTIPVPWAVEEMLLAKGPRRARSASLPATLSGYSPLFEQRVQFSVEFKSKADYERVVAVMGEGHLWESLDVMVTLPRKRAKARRPVRDGGRSG